MVIKKRKTDEKATTIKLTDTPDDAATAITRDRDAALAKVHEIVLIMDGLGFSMVGTVLLTSLLNAVITAHSMLKPEEYADYANALNDGIAQLLEVINSPAPGATAVAQNTAAAVEREDKSRIVVPGGFDFKTKH